MNAVWVIVEAGERGLRDASLEVLGEGRALADSLRVPLHAAALGNDLQPLVDDLTRQDVDAVYRLEHPLLAEYSAEGWATALESLFAGALAGPVLLSGTPLGADLAPRLAARLRIPCVMDCIWVKSGPAGDVRIVQPVHQDRAQRTLSSPAGAPLVAALRPGVIGVEPPKRSRTPAVIEFTPPLEPAHLLVRVVDFQPGDPTQLPLAEAEVIVAGGRGVDGEAGWALLRELAQELGAVLGGSRVALDLGHIARPQMIGQTGAWISPRLYLTAGISGASHHAGGVRAGVWIAVNSDAHAPVFKLSTLKVAGDLHAVLPVLLHKLRAARGEG